MTPKERTDAKIRLIKLIANGKNGEAIAFVKELPADDMKQIVLDVWATLVATAKALKRPEAATEMRLLGQHLLDSIDETDTQ